MHIAKTKVASPSIFGSTFTMATLRKETVHSHFMGHSAQTVFANIFSFVVGSSHDKYHLFSNGEVHSHNLGAVFHKKMTYHVMIALVLVVFSLLLHFLIIGDTGSRTHYA